MDKYSAEFVASFWSRVTKTEGCWLWQGAPTASGYGQLKCRAISSVPLLAHRVSWELASDREVPTGLHVLHNCPGGDNPLCVNPAHLWLGTTQDNSKDRDAKGRVARGDRNGARTCRERNSFVRNGGSGLRGEEHPMALLSDREARAIRKAYLRGVSRVKLAREYNVHVSTIRSIGKGRTRADA